MYAGKPGRHFSSRVREHFVSDKNWHIFKHLKGSDNGSNVSVVPEVYVQ